MLSTRYLNTYVEKDLAKKMVFLAGPRQVGKTTLALNLLKNGNEHHAAYFNWDVPGRNHALIQGLVPSDEPLIVLDEIHKYRKWRNLVKGLYDHYKGRIKFLVTGSARLDYFSRGGDSLHGRYHLFRLHPLSLREADPSMSRNTVDRLLTYGGFPEPYFEADEVQWRRWQRERLKRVVQEDLLSLEQVKDVSQITLLGEILPTKVGAPLSIQNLRNDLDVAHETAERWVKILENLYYCFRVMPFGSPKIKAVKKEQKLYLWDWSQCIDSSARFENMVACQLLKYCHFLEDTQGLNMELRYIRNVERKEIDFVVIQDRKPAFAIEVKQGREELSSNIKYFSQRLNIPHFYQVYLGQEPYESAQYRATVLPFEALVRKLGLP